MKKFKVLHVVVAKIWGGGEQYVYDICKEMQRQGHTIFIAVDKTNCMFQQRYAEVATVLPVNLYFVAGLFAVNELKNIIASESIDVINCHSGHGVLLCLLLKFLSGKKLVLFKHNALLAKMIYIMYGYGKCGCEYLCVKTSAQSADARIKGI